MARITVEDCLCNENNRFALVLLAAKRAKQLLNGAPSVVAEVKNKHVVTALREIAAGSVTYLSEEEQQLREAAKQSEEVQSEEVAGSTTSNGSGAVEVEDSSESADNTGDESDESESGDSEETF